MEHTRYVLYLFYFLNFFKYIFCIRISWLDYFLEVQNHFKIGLYKKTKSHIQKKNKNQWCLVCSPNLLKNLLSVVTKCDSSMNWLNLISYCIFPTDEFSIEWLKNRIFRAPKDIKKTFPCLSDRQKTSSQVS